MKIRSELQTTDLKASRNLDDCERALVLLEEVPRIDEQLFRIYWTVCLVFLRKTNEDLIHSDFVSFPQIKVHASQRFKELSDLVRKTPDETPFEECHIDYLIFERLMHLERNNVVHGEEPSYSLDTWTAFSDDGDFEFGDLYLTMSDIEKWGDWDCRDWIHEAIKWWRTELQRLVDLTNADTEAK